VAKRYNKGHRPQTEDLINLKEFEKNDE